MGDGDRPIYRVRQAYKEASAREESEMKRLIKTCTKVSHTQPGIAYAVSIASQFLHSPRKAHLQVVHRILQYLKGSLGKGIVFKRDTGLHRETYTDADYIGSVTDRRSTSRYCFLIGGNLITSRSKKQNVVARPSAEAEYRAMALGICEQWLKIVINDLKIKWQVMWLYRDNKAAINIANNAIQNDRTIHIEVNRYFIKEKIDGS